MFNEADTWTFNVAYTGTGGGRMIKRLTRFFTKTSPRKFWLINTLAFSTAGLAISPYVEPNGDGVATIILMFASSFFGLNAYGMTGIIDRQIELSIAIKEAMAKNNESYEKLRAAVDEVDVKNAKVKHYNSHAAIVKIKRDRGQWAD